MKLTNVEKSLEYYKNTINNFNRNHQLDTVVEIIKDIIDPDLKIKCIETGASSNIEDGCVGLFFAKLCELTKGEFHSVEINLDLILKSKNLYKKHDLNVKHHHQDSVNYLKTTEFIPNLIHLDSWDLDLMDPFPSALHGWREFTAIEDKMPIGSIIIIDDNFFKGTWVDYNVMINREYNGEVKRIDIEYPIIGKGSMVYHFVISRRIENNWEKISLDTVGHNIKLIFKKVK